MTVATAPDVAPDSLSPIGMAVAPLERYREFLTSKGQRMTSERETIVEEIFSTHEHFDADELIARLTRVRGGRRVSRSTIYRNLSLLEEAGLIRKVVRKDDREIFEHDYGYPKHDHLVCRQCGTLIEFHNEAINEVLVEIARQRGFRIEGHRLEVQGLCDSCCRPPESRPKKLNLL
ncbi:MAG: transcriptional repressor [Planctomycetaceae bacterium]|nr:transcriptional repressor [Planctomycetaceae bacterium]